MNEHVNDLFDDFLDAVDESFAAAEAYAADTANVALQRASHAANDKALNARAKVMREVKGRGYSGLNEWFRIYHWTPTGRGEA